MGDGAKRRLTLTLMSADATEPAPDYETLVAQGQEAERLGQRSTARELYERALAHMEREDHGRQASTIMRWIARTYVGDARMEDAMATLDAAVAVAEEWGDEAAAGSAINVKAVVQWQLGDLDEAERLYLVARGHALRAGDAKLSAMTAQNLGVIANVRGDTELAQRHYEASLAEYRTLGLAKDVSVALNNLGLLHTQSERWGEAERAFNEAVQITDALGDLSARILLDVNLAELWVERGDFVRAQQCVRHALELSSRSGDVAAIGQASKLQGIIARESGDAAEAEAQFSRAQEIAKARGDVLLEAEVAREAGELARRQGRNSLVLQHLNRSHRLFTQLRARRDLADIGSRTEHLEDEFLQVARRWGESIEAKDRYTQGHCVRVADMACAIASELHFEEQELFWFRIGALLHDVGKLVIPEEVLNKPGKLTDEEWGLMRSHTTAGVEMLSDIEFPWDVLPIVRSHHERWDGRGYPDQLAGEDIPLVARILCLADVYDALTSVRSYKSALSHDRAVELMRGDAGTMFDPELFGAFERVAASWVDQEASRAEAIAASQATEQAPASGATGVDMPELDDLTHLPLRRAFRETAARVLEARRTTTRPVSLLVIDIDHFKLVNDTFGHLQGDAVLRAVADVVRVHTRPSDYPARYAGDEFVVMLPGTGAEQAMEIAERLRGAVQRMASASLDGRSEPVHVTLSIGVATAPAHGESLDVVFAAADGALYAAKRRGRNTVGVANGLGPRRDGALLLDSFVGRHAERQRLTRLLDGTTQGVPAVVAVVGKAGVGKSSLLRQLAPEVSMRAGSFMVGRCLEGVGQSQFGPWIDILNAIHAMQLVPPRPWRELGRLVPEVAGAWGAAHESPATRADSHRLLQEIADYIGLAAIAKPLVIVMEDMQWADAEAWDVFDLLVPRLSGERLLLAMTLRDEDLSTEATRRRGVLSRHACFTEIALEALPNEQIEHWLRLALGGQVPDASLSSDLIRQTEGNPFFAVQLLRHLVESGAVQFAEGSWQYAPITDHGLPTPIRDLLARRLCRLSDATREVLVGAAVFGSHFDADSLPLAVARSEEAVLEAIDDGIRAHVLAPVQGTGASAFRFTHGLLAEALRRGSNPLRLRRVHERVARHLVAQPNADACVIAEHFDRAGCRPDALHYAQLASARAMRVYAYDQAAACLEMALRHASTAVELVQVQWNLASLDESVGRFASAEARCEEILGRYTDGADSLNLVPVVRRMRERLRLMRGAPLAEVRVHTEVLLAEAERDGNLREVVAVRMMLSQVHARLGDDDRAEELAREAIQKAAQLEDAQLNAEAVMRLGSTVLHRTPADAVAHYRQALDLFVRVNDRIGQLRCHINIGVACDRAGNNPAAEMSYLRALELGREVKAIDLTGLASMNLGVLLSKSGRFEDATERFEETLRLCGSIGHELHRVTALFNLAHVARERADYAGALELYETTRTLAGRLQQLDVHVGAVSGLGLTELALGHQTTASSYLTTARSLLAGREGPWFQERELFEALEIRLMCARGDATAAASRLMVMLPLAEEFDQHASVWLVAECVHLLSGVQPDWLELAQRYAVRARALGYETLRRRLSMLGVTAAAAGENSSASSVASAA